MTIPDYQTLMLPLLEWLANKKECTVQEAYQHFAELYRLTASEQNQLLPSGKQTVIKNRIGWAKTYLKKAGLINTPKRGVWQITEEGLLFLAQKPTKIRNEDLIKIPAFQSFRAVCNRPMTHNSSEELFSETNKKETPNEQMDASYASIREALATELLTTIKSCSPAFFEQLVVDVMLSLGYGGSKREGKTTSLTADGGIDGVIKEDKLGLDMIYLQAKRWENVVGRPEIQKFAGALQGERAKKGVFITTSDFTKEALEYINRLDVKIVLINGLKLAELMIDYDVGVSTKQTYEVKQIDSDYFEES